MKSIKTTTVLGLAILFSLIFLNQSCSIQKRTYNKGYFVQWNGNKKASTGSASENLTSSVSDNEVFNKKEAAESEVLLVENESIETELVPTSNSIVENSELIQDNVFESENKNGKSVYELKQSKQLKKDNLSVSKVKSLKKSKKAYFDWELGINILLTVVFLGLIILFVVLALNSVMPTILIWGILGLISLVLFITQIIDLINY
ncbi:MAG: hypothetical protein V4622_04895 [Bacteroidota bacterium]